MAHISLETELSNRARRAYRSLDEAEQARRELAETLYDGLPARIGEEASRAEGAYMEAHVRLTDREPFGDDSHDGVDDVHHGEELAADHAPTHPQDVAVARDAAIRLRNTGLTALRLVEQAANVEHIEIDGNGYTALRDAATRLIGNAEAFRDAVSEDYERDAEEFLAEQTA
jgi:hypothetical protein